MAVDAWIERALPPILPPRFDIGTGRWSRADLAWWLVFLEIWLSIQAPELDVNTEEAGDAAELEPGAFEAGDVAVLELIASEGTWLALVPVRERVA
jgi:hypothetical protein